MPLISRYDKSTLPWKRTTGLYGHWWNNGYVPYLRLVGKNKTYTLWWAGNPYRPGKVVEWFSNEPFSRVDRPRWSVVR